MDFQENVGLNSYSTMRLGGPARWLVAVRTREELREAILWARGQSVPFLVLGEGSNVIFTDAGFPGLVILNRISGFTTGQPSGAGGNQLAAQDGEVHVTIGAGENWDSAVARTVELGLHGIEALSLIPGTAGATPVQNVGAYGQDISQTLHEVHAYDTETDSFVTLSASDCQFGYRSSIFNGSRKGRYAITGITLVLNHGSLCPPLYASLQEYMDRNGITDYSPSAIRQAVIAVRSEKLPDPARLANTGSFFKNPIIDAVAFERIRAVHPNMPHFTQRDGTVKLLAGWLIDNAGLKGYASHGMKTYEKNALVFVNQSASTHGDLLAFKAEIVERVQEKYGVTLVQEPETV